jgi:hypothetical protein
MNSDTTGNIVEKLSIKDLISDFKIESLSIGKFKWTGDTNIVIIVLEK